MKVGFVGCGKLGLPVALAIESCGHQVRGYDIDTRLPGYLTSQRYPHKEEGISALLGVTEMRILPLQELCDWADILFLAIQTPHQERFEGHMPLPDDRADFDYQYLRAAVADVNACLTRPTVCVVISTVLPGTIEREVKPLMGTNFRLVYEPLFIAMGTVIDDFLNPEFVLAGSEDPMALQALEAFYKTIHNKPVFKTDIRTAEGIKVFYNTFITAKTVLANLYGEMAERCGMNVDDIFRALTMATDRLISPKYLKAGMGDGGGCHPRDNIALSWLARQKNISFDFFSALMEARERHCEWLAETIDLYRRRYGYEYNGKEYYLPVFLLGRSFKPETNIETGSPALLLGRILQQKGIPYAHDEDMTPTAPGVYFIATRHQRYTHYRFPELSVVIDPFRYIPRQSGVKVIAIGGGAPVSRLEEEAAPCRP